MISKEEKEDKQNSMNLDDDWEVDIDGFLDMTKKMKEGYNTSEFPIFMKECPNDIADNPHLLALQEMLYDPKDTPEQIAANFKNAGNEVYKDGRQHYKDAYVFYTKGIEMESNDKELNSTLYSNRAHILLLTHKYTECIDDCRKAIELNSKNAKAYFRAAKASYCLGLYKQSKDFCDKGILETNEKEIFEKFMNTMLSSYIKKLNDTKSKIFEEEQKNKKAEILQRKKFLTICKSRGIKLVEERYEIAKGASFQAYVDECNDLHWPVLLLYEEVMISDMIADFNENDTLKQHMQIIFPGDSFAPWDTNHEYKYTNISIFFEACTGTSEIMFHVSLNFTLKQIINAVKIVAGVPVFHIIRKNSAAEDLFLKQNRVEKLP